MGGYPPGTSRRDLIRGGIIESHDHEHEWEMDDHRADPIIEDGAAIFHLQCRYVEGRYGEGWKCEETKTYRFEYNTLVTPFCRGDECYELPEIDEWENDCISEDFDDYIGKAVIEVEERFHSGDKDVTIEVDPDPDDGEVVIKWHGLELSFTP
jgi:hypothetical protein